MLEGSTDGGRYMPYSFTPPAGVQPSNKSLTSAVSINGKMLTQSPSTSSRVCMSWVPSLQFNEYLYVERCNMSDSASLP